MSFLLKNRETLTQLFTTFSLQEIVITNQNLTASWHLLTTPPAQLLVAMKEKQVSIEHFLGKKCLPLIRFYLADEQQQKETFLSAPLLAQLFVSLPAVEAIIFKDQIQSAQRVVQQTNQALSSLFLEEKLPMENSVAKKDPVVQLNQYQLATKQSLSLLSDAHKKYLNCFYYLKSAELFVVEEGELINGDMLLYSELSPLQQLQAQQMFTKKTNRFQQHSASA